MEIKLNEKLYSVSYVVRNQYNLKVNNVYIGTYSKAHLYKYVCDIYLTEHEDKQNFMRFLLKIKEIS